MSSDPDLDPNRCPACGAPNQCAVSTGSAEPCWCESVSIPEAALARVPAAAVDKACLCPRCALSASGVRESA